MVVSKRISPFAFGGEPPGWEAVVPVISPSSTRSYAVSTSFSFPVAVGSVLSFVYPADNRFGVRTRLCRRTMVIEEIRDCQAVPVEEWAIQLRPDIRRGPLLLIGRDLDRNERRQFYASSMRSIQTVRMPVYQLAYCDPETFEPVHFFGNLWTGRQSDLDQARNVMRRLYASFERRGQAVLPIRLFPIDEAGLLNVSSCQSA